MSHLLYVSPTESGIHSIVTAPFRGPGYDTTTFAYEFYKGLLGNVIVIYEVEENSGYSVTNSAERLYAPLKQRFSPDKPLFLFESYHLIDGAERLDVVITDGDMVDWYPFSVKTVERLIGGLRGPSGT